MTNEVIHSVRAFLAGTMFAGNEVWRILALFLAIFGAFAAGKIGRAVLVSAAARAEKKRAAVLAVTLQSLAAAAGFVAFAIGLRIGVQFLRLGERVAGGAATATGVLVILAIGWLAYCLVDVVGTWLARMADRRPSRMNDMLVPLVRKSLRVTIALLVLLQIATALSDKPVTSLIAGLGVGGLAVALAAQDSLKNFFGSIVIFADKPFELGDRIVVDGHDGPVEEVGFRSTRIRTLDGHLVTIPNGELANKTIQNIGRRPHIKRVANITIPYDTPPGKVERAIDVIKDVLKDHEGMDPAFPPRVYFSEFNDASLNLLVLYWYAPPDYWKYMEFSERFNMEILKRFNAEGIEFAFPTQTLFLAGDPKRPLTPGG